MSESVEVIRGARVWILPPGGIRRCVEGFDPEPGDIVVAREPHETLNECVQRVHRAHEVTCVYSYAEVRA